jgi:hypothetical protein
VLIEYRLPLVVVIASPVLEPVLKPEKVIAPALALFVESTMQELSLAGAARTKAPPFVINCNGDCPQSTV